MPSIETKDSTNYGYSVLFCPCFILCELDVPMLLIELGAIIVSTIASLLIFGVIIMTSDISEGESHGMNSRNSSRVSSQSGKGRYSAQTMRMLKRNIRRRWL